MAVATPVTFVLIPSTQSLVTSGGQTITGPFVSIIVIVWTQVAVLPQLSAAAQVRYADSGSFPELLAIYNLFGDPALRIR